MSPLTKITHIMPLTARFQTTRSAALAGPGKR